MVTMWPMALAPHFFDVFDEAAQILAFLKTCTSACALELGRLLDKCFQGLGSESLDVCAPVKHVHQPRWGAFQVVGVPFWAWAVAS